MRVLYPQFLIISSILLGTLWLHFNRQYDTLWPLLISKQVNQLGNYSDSVLNFFIYSCRVPEISSPCSLELISLAYQPWYSVFLSQQISQQYFQSWLISQANRTLRFSRFNSPFCQSWTCCLNLNLVWRQKGHEIPTNAQVVVLTSSLYWTFNPATASICMTA
jgi:hypothetical protein